MVFDPLLPELAMALLHSVRLSTEQALNPSINVKAPADRSDIGSGSHKGVEQQLSRENFMHIRGCLH